MQYKSANPGVCGPAEGFMGLQLTKWRAVEGLAVGVEDMYFVHAAFSAGAVGPDVFFIGGDFEKFDVGFAGGAVAADHGVAVGEALGAAGVVEERGGQVGIRELPDDCSILVDFYDHVAMGAADEAVAGFEADGADAASV